MSNADTVIVLDFETTGLSPACGDRAIEIGAVRIEGGEITGRFQELMNPGRNVSGFIVGLTGISNAMLAEARPCHDVMHEFADFIDGYNLVAHNASFDKGFLDAELRQIGRAYTGEFACSMLAARRIYPEAENHKLGTLVRHLNIPTAGGFHRALYDSEMTAQVWLTMLDEIDRRFDILGVPFTTIQKLSKTSKWTIGKLFRE
jgi:DNA polymerase-3 subunit epsilon